MDQKFFQTHELAARSGEQVIIMEYQDPPAAKGTILITAAMGVRQYYYRYLAQFFVEQGYKVYSMDYSGMGMSKSRSIRAYRNITIDDWLVEVEDVVDWVASQQPTSGPLFYVCHSLGGQIFGLLSNNHKFKAMISITSQNGYYKFYQDNHLYYYLFWHVLLPPITHLLGYFPSSWFNLGEKLPKQMALSWKRWCTTPDYFFSDPTVPQLANYATYSGSILTISFTDDPWATEEAVESLVSNYSAASITHRHINPKDVGLDAIGHLGYFRPKCRPLWSQLDEWFQQH